MYRRHGRRGKPPEEPGTGVSRITQFEDLVPLLFAHSMYKSYPASLLDKKRFDLVMRWLSKLTPVDLSHVDVAGCDSIDEWNDRMDAQTPLGLITSAGTANMGDHRSVVGTGLRAGAREAA